jgi:hypothetical protein
MRSETLIAQCCADKSADKPGSRRWLLAEVDRHSALFLVVEYGDQFQAGT